jgi:Protein of unknown function DUF45
MTTTQAGSLVAVGNLTLRRVSGARPAIRTDRSDMLTLVLPEEATEEDARQVVLRHYGSVSRWLAVGDVVNAWEPLAKELVPGEGFLLSGRSHRMCWRSPDAVHAAAFEPTDHGVWLKVHPNLKDRTDAAREAILDCYRRESIDVVRRRFSEYAARVGVGSLGSVIVADDDAYWLRLRVGRNGLTVTAHWALAQFGISNVDYLLCRALCARAKRDLRGVFPDQYAPRRLHDEARDVWTGQIARR